MRVENLKLKIKKNSTYDRALKNDSHLCQQNIGTDRNRRGVERKSLQGFSNDNSRPLFRAFRLG